MRILLTSGGITNQSMVNVLKSWVKDINIVFIPTAANVEEGDKDWLITDYVNCNKLGSVDIVDISAIDNFNSPKTAICLKLIGTSLIGVTMST